MIKDRDETALGVEHETQRRSLSEKGSSAEPGPELSHVSVASGRSNEHIINFEGSGRQTEQRFSGSKSEPNPSCVSIKTDASKDLTVTFREGQRKQHERTSLRSDTSMDLIETFKDGGSSVQKTTEVLSGPCVQQEAVDLHPIFKLLEENIITFVKNELKKIQKVLGPDYLKSSESQREDEEVSEGEDEEQRRSNREAFLKITENFLRTMKQDKLVDHLGIRTRAPAQQRQLKSTLKNKFQRLFEGVAQTGNPTLLNQVFTELHLTEGGAAEVNDEHEVRQIETASLKPHRPEEPMRHEDLFKTAPGRPGPVRTVMTRGVAGIGKTVLTQKFTLDWAEDRAHQDVHFIFPFSFRELNVVKEKKFSLMELIHHFFTETKDTRICSFDQFKVIFIFDGLDECRLPLDLHGTEVLTDVTESTSVQVLLTNLIRGNLLPSARLWITSRPAAADQIPLDLVDVVTEVRGFTDVQKEEYFRRRFRDEEQANKIISHIQASRSLHIMCHIPVFCWITATVLEDVVRTRGGGAEELPKTLTEMYVYFLVIQSKLINVKYHERSAADPHWSPENMKMIQTLGKLAFEQLQRGNLIFYHSDLKDCGVDIKEASVYSGVFTQVFREERGLFQDKVFCFVHLSVQEFLAALHVLLTFIKSGVNLLVEQPPRSLMEQPPRSLVPKLFRDKPELRHLHRSAVDKALLSPNGHLDLFLRFLLGLSLGDNQRLLREVLTPTGCSSETNQKTAEYIKKKIGRNLSAERSINLFHCLNELKDGSLVEDIQQSLRSGCLSTEKMSPAQWSALVFILLSSGKDLEVFDLKKFSASEEALLRLLLVVKASTTAVLRDCNLSERSCENLSSVLRSQSSSLRHLDLSNNHLMDSGVEKLCAGLKSPHCCLETLSLSGCLVTHKGCSSLASALSSNPSHLRELDLSYNHPGHSGQKVLSDGLNGPHWRLETLRLDHSGPQRLLPGVRKYSYELELDSNTVNKYLKLSEDSRSVTNVARALAHPDHPHRFDHWPQVLCRPALTGRCSWELRWSGDVLVSVSCGEIRRKGKGPESSFSHSHQSWSLSCSDVRGYSVRHAKKETYVHSPVVSHRVSVFVDVPAGTVSFYRVSSDSLLHLHTFSTKFSGPVYPGFWVSFNSSVFLVKSVLPV